MQPPPKRDWLERFGPAAACVGVIGLLCWSAYESLKPDPARDAGLVAAVPVKAGGAADGSTPAVDPVAAPTPPAPVEPAPAPAVAVAEPAAEPEAKPEPEPAKAAPEAEAEARPEPKPVDVPAGSSSVVSRLEGMLLRHDADRREWVRVREGDGARVGDRLLSAPTSSARLDGPDGAIVLLGDTEIRVLDDAADDGPNFELIRGRVLAEPSSRPRPLHVVYQGTNVDMDRPADLAIGQEAAKLWKYGVVEPAAPALTVHVAPGRNLALKTVKSTTTIEGPVIARVEAGGAVTTTKQAAAPDWLAAPEASAERTARREKFLKEFAEDRPVLTDVVSATENPDPDVKADAIDMLRGLGDLSLLTPILERPEDPVARRAAIAAIREECASGETAARRASDQLESDLGSADRARLEKLLRGYPHDQAKQATFEELVESLSSREPTLAARELAFDNLCRLTGRDEPAYDADQPEPGYAAWRKLLEEGALKPVVGK